MRNAEFKFMLFSLLVFLFLFVFVDEVRAGCGFSDSWEDEDCPYVDCWDQCGAREIDPSLCPPRTYGCIICEGNTAIFYSCDRPCECAGGDGGGAPDTTPPRCRIAIEPSYQDVTVRNYSFENGEARWTGWGGGASISTEKKKEGDKSAKFEGGTVDLRVSQDIDVSKNHLYRLSAWGWGENRLARDDIDGDGQDEVCRLRRSPLVAFDEAKEGREGANQWQKVKGSFFARDGTATIQVGGQESGTCRWIAGSSWSDLVEMQEVVGAASTTIKNVKVQIGLWDDRSIYQYRIRNKGGTWGDWVDFSYSDAWNPVNWTLPSGYASSYEVEVQVRDSAENKSEICSDKIGYISPPGTIIGAVYDVTGLASACVAGGTQINPAASKIIGQAGTVSRTPIGQGSVGSVAIDTGAGSYSMLNIEGGSYQLTANIAGYFGSQACYPDIGFAYVSIPPDKVVDIGLSQAQGSWFQTQDGNVHAGGSINSGIPEAATEKYFCLNGSGGYPGVVSYNGSSADFTPAGSVSAPPAEWLAKTSSSRKSYNYFYQLLGSPNPETPPPLGSISLPDNNGVVVYNDNIKTAGNWNVGTKKIVILTEKRFLIKHRITVDNGGSLVVIAKEGIGVFKNIGDADPVQGIFLTDGTFSSSTEEDFTSVESNRQLVIDGGVIAGQVDLKRDLETDNSSIPAEKFIFRPDFLINSHPDLWRAPHTWEELAP